MLGLHQTFFDQYWYLSFWFWSYKMSKQKIVKSYFKKTIHQSSHCSILGDVNTNWIGFKKSGRMLLS